MRAPSRPASSMAATAAGTASSSVLVNGVDATATRIVGMARSLARRVRGPEQATLEGAHGRFFVGLGMVPSADVEGTVRDEQAHLVRRRPGDVARLSAATLDGLLDRPLDRDDDVAEMGSPAGGQRERGIEHREREDIR